MTYHCGIGPGIPGLAPREPHIECDDCGATYAITARGAPPKWLLDGKAPRGWRKIVGIEDTTHHQCPACRKGSR